MDNLLISLISTLVGILIGFLISKRIYKKRILKKLRSRTLPLRRGFIKDYYSNPSIQALLYVVEIDRLNDMSKIKIIDIKIQNFYKDEYLRENDNQWIDSSKIDFATNGDNLKLKLEELIKLK